MKTINYRVVAIRVERNNEIQLDISTHIGQILLSV